MGKQAAEIPTITAAPPISTAGAVIPQAASRATQVLNFVIVSGATIPVTISGSMFYLLAATAQVAIRPRGGVFTLYPQGTGQNYRAEDAFPSLEINNPNSFSVVISVVIGWDTFVDNRLILAQAQYPNVAFPTYPTANAAAVVHFVDLSGTAFTDINGGKWYALYRVAIVISNLDTGVTYLLQKAGATGPSSPAVAAIFPATSFNEPLSGNYDLNLGGANINVVAHELYASIPANPAIGP